MRGIMWMNLIKLSFLVISHIHYDLAQAVFPKASFNMSLTYNCKEASQNELNQTSVLSKKKIQNLDEG